MAASDAVVGNLKTIYVAVIVGIKAYGVVSGRSFGGFFVLLISTVVVCGMLVVSLTWDLSRKATCAVKFRDDEDVHESCKGGICWHGIAVRSSASSVRFKLPDHIVGYV